MSTQHTPGPWGLYYNANNDFTVRKMFKDGTESHEVARCRSGSANARLIAAAPEMFAALQQALDALECEGGPDDPGHRCGACDEYVDRNGLVRKAIRAAIDAAMGKSNAA